MTSDGGIDHDKYVVFKREDIMKWASTDTMDNFPTALPDSVVIRLQDAFAASALASYAQSIQTTIELFQVFGYPSNHVTQRLRRIADYFMEMSDKSSHMQHKLPD